MRNPLLTAQQGQEGTFPRWLEDLGLKDFLERYPLPQLIEWGWVVPQHRVIFPNEFFVAWQNFPYLDSEVAPGFESYSLLWDSYWLIDSTDEPLWFLHPFFRPGDAVVQILAEHGETQVSAQIPAPFTHPNGRAITPYADYFFHWQGYALIDVIRSADCIAPLLNTPDVEQRAANMAREAEYAKQHDPRGVLTTPKRWGGLSAPITWLSHYRAFRDSLWHYENQHELGLSLRRAGAKQLADHLGVTVEMLSHAIKDQLLVLAQDWRWANDRYCVWTLRAWPYLQRDISIAMEWLCYLSGKHLDDFLDEWQYTHIGQEQWAELHVVLPHEFFTDRQHFLRLAPHYLKSYNALLPEVERLDGDILRDIVDRLRLTNYPFGSFLGAFRQLHEELSYRPDQKGGPDFRELRPLDYYSLLAIRAENSMRYFMEKEGSLVNIDTGKQGLPAYIIYLAQQRGLPREAIDVFCQHLGLARLNSAPDDPIGPIMGLTLNLGPREDYWVRAFLCCMVARNYFAHHHYLDDQLLQSEKSAFMLSGIVTTVLFLL